MGEFLSKCYGYNNIYIVDFVLKKHAFYSKCKPSMYLLVYWKGCI